MNNGPILSRGIIVFLKAAWTSAALLICLSLTTTNQDDNILRWIILLTIPVAWKAELWSASKLLASFVRGHWLAIKRFGAVALVTALGLLALSFFRYEVMVTSGSAIVVRLDRLTGRIDWCVPRKGCVGTEQRETEK